PGMGIEKPYEVEIGELREPPGGGAPKRVSLADRARELIRPSPHGVVVAGVVLETTRADPARAADELPAPVVHRFEERRPNADDHAWRRFVDVVHGIARDRRYADYDLAWELIEAIDGL